MLRCRCLRLLPPLIISAYVSPIFFAFAFTLDAAA